MRDEYLNTIHDNTREILEMSYYMVKLSNSFYTTGNTTLVLNFKKWLTNWKIILILSILQ